MGIRSATQSKLQSAIIALFAVVGLLACTSDKLVPLQERIEQSVVLNDVNVNFCTDPAYNQKQYLKTIVILDHSGSNQENYLMAADGSGAPALPIVVSKMYATDPTGSTRYGSVTTPGTLLNYLSTLPPNDPNDPTKFFALVDFNSQITPYPANGFTSDIPAFAQYVLQDSKANMGMGPADGDSTSYVGALGQAQTIITTDIQNATNCAALPLGSPSPGAWCPTPGKEISSSYVIVFMSDGSPITNISGVGVDAGGNIVVTGTITITKESTTDILEAASALVSLTSNAKFVTSVNLFTIYYYYPGNVDTSGQALLASMAKVGNGVAYNALSGSNINYAQFQPPAKRIKYTLADVFVTNASVVWWTDGKLHADTDMDGLPDDVETAWGSDPNNAYTAGNGVKDSVRYQLSGGAACMNKNGMGICTDPVANYKAGDCSGVNTLPSGVFVSSDPDGLNDCEKILLGDIAGVDNPDSNNDLLPDWLEFKNGVPFQNGTIPGINVQDQDGLTIYQKIKTSLPVNAPSSELLNYTPSTYNLQLVSTNDTQDCYKLTVNNLPSMSASDTVRVEVIEKSALLQDNDLYRVGQKAYTSGSYVLNFNDWNNAAEIANKTWSMWP